MFFSASDLLALFALSTCVLFLMRRFARIVGLVDKPNARKLHSGSVPLVGGISICISLLFFLWNNADLIPHTDLYSVSILVLVIIGALDDRFDISYKIRFLIQALLSIAMIEVGNIELSTIGNILGTGDIDLGIAGYIITILAVVGAINAFNMVDGIDGLLGGLSVVTFAGVAFMMTTVNHYDLAYLSTAMIVIMAPYILFNLGLLGRKRKVFMGDAGSMVIGFTIVWFLLLSSQTGQQASIRPVTCLWLIAIPLMDMAAIMFRRVRRGHSPFRPDREHLHHIFQRLGLSSTQTLLVICSVAALFAGFGIYGELTGINESIMFVSFIFCFAVYAVLLSYVWRITRFVRSLRKQDKPEQVLNG
ncbi:undecaprenyl-phosphate alpha-N-acetylglucosaminyl 1-phosphate transferase [Salinivibrio kushneri]|uniref:UDP-N-acetylglucosamine--undecaprenyl-phosphate N-acetylglucosaminephosphotransferase n=2 Tax=Salinivibrio kushneri TaxID=1908198 RepID=UPI000988B257|nr:UDP-N-acetylglucosamine--undecaprenyl-phosphate N-acetylglucosaminephosphotransferase [Salinivibrio kushneri]OOE49389.1 undecaprenyl-phosphate alpha-N-acetylglucosaminyl 1-phosphate transferase [Salinivibrio kushneri]